MVLCCRRRYLFSAILAIYMTSSNKLDRQMIYLTEADPREKEAGKSSEESYPRPRIDRAIVCATSCVFMKSIRSREGGGRWLRPLPHNNCT